tara:strand:+ start:274 stop:1014 length:741 start_codon:yes stop_codon:yes gene_type:complete
MSRLDDKGMPWNDHELRVALDAYLYMLQLQLAKIPFSPSSHSEILLSGPLYRRNDAAVRYRMRNLSFVLSQRDLPVLDAFSPAPQVGRMVKKRIEDILDERAQVVDAIVAMEGNAGADVSISDLVGSLSELKQQIEKLSKAQKAGIGHNNPPEHMEIEESDLAESISALDQIINEVRRPQTEKKKIESWVQPVTTLGTKLSIWVGQRATDFFKAGAVAAGTSWGLAASGIGEQIVETLRALFRFLG